MKKLVLIAVAGAALSTASLVHAQTVSPVPNGTEFDPATVLATGVANPSNISVAGTIEEFIQFTDVDNALELGNIGGANLNGTAVSVTGRRSDGTGTAPFAKNTDTGAGLGDAKVEFNANTFVRVAFSSADLRNNGVDATANTADDYTLPTFFRVAVKGKVDFASGNTSLGGGPVDYPGTTGQNPTNPGDYGSYSDPRAAAAAHVPASVDLVYYPGGPVNDGFGNPAPANSSSGFRIMSEVTRKGLNDYKGNYTTAINLKYYKF